jgi:hypothetical protein
MVPAEWSAQDSIHRCCRAMSRRVVRLTHRASTSVIAGDSRKDVDHP